MISKKDTDQDGRLGIGFCLAVGFIAGAVVPCVRMWPELSKRWHWASGGDGGESADWGEPLFYMLIQSIPAGLIGGAMALVIAFAIRYLTRIGRR